ncbi:MAG TPA: peptidoglycan DD-metalloendopeptidase family protein [Polyangiaceae bacterium]|nr:peptidoglycan DD-metalloendopeptidase family protein [Polyangiaceae bacterium]
MKRARDRFAFVCVAVALISAQKLPSAGAAPGNGDRRSAAAEVERLLGSLEREEKQTRQAFDVLGARSQALQARVLVRARAYVRSARAGLLPVADGFAALVEHATRQERWRSALGRDLLEQERVAAERARLALRLQELNERLAPLRLEQEAIARAETALLSAEDRQRAFERAFQSSATPAHAAVYGAVGPSDPTELAAGFAAMKGRLPFPLTGRSEIQPTRRRSGAEGPGLAMRAPLGTAVRAVYPGRVAFADSYADYGKTVIVDHGQRHYTVSGNLGSVDVAVGEEVQTNTRLGTVGDSAEGALLYFELRVGSTTVNPSDWFGL